MREAGRERLEKILRQGATHTAREKARVMCVHMYNALRGPGASGSVTKMTQRPL